MNESPNADTAETPGGAKQTPAPSAPSERLVTRKELAATLGVCSGSIARMIARGALPPPDLRLNHKVSGWWASTLQRRLGSWR